MQKREPPRVTLRPCLGVTLTSNSSRNQLESTVPSRDNTHDARSSQRILRDLGHLCEVCLEIYYVLEALIPFILDEVKLIQLIISYVTFLFLEEKDQVLRGGQLIISLF